MAFTRVSHNNQFTVNNDKENNSKEKDDELSHDKEYNDIVQLMLSGTMYKMIDMYITV